MTSFNVILGMDWFSSYHAIIDCYHKRVMVCTSSGDYFYFLRDRANRVLWPVYDSRGRGELSCLLAAFLGSESDVARVELLRVVCEYSDVFSEDLTSLSSYQKIEFSIDLVPGTAPISMAPYRFVPAELYELKIQLQELLDKGFIRPSTSPWRAPALFAKKKDQTNHLYVGMGTCP